MYDNVITSADSNKLGYIAALKNAKPYYDRVINSLTQLGADKADANPILKEQYSRSRRIIQERTEKASSWLIVYVLLLIKEKLFSCFHSSPVDKKIAKANRSSARTASSTFHFESKKENGSSSKTHHSQRSYVIQ